MIKKTFLFFIFVFFFMVSQAQDLQLVITSNMNGAFADCQCGEGPSGSMARLKEYALSGKSCPDLWIDAGNFSTTYPFFEFNQLIWEHMLELPYACILPAENEEIQGQEYLNELRSAASPDKKVVFASDTVLYLHKNGIQVTLWVVDSPIKLSAIPAKNKQMNEVRGIICRGGDPILRKKVLQRIKPDFIFITDSDTAAIRREKDGFLLIHGGIEAFGVPVLTINKTESGLNIKGDVISLLQFPENKKWFQAYNNFKDQKERNSYE